jgi:hypothetical protein
VHDVVHLLDCRGGHDKSPGGGERSGS